MNCFKKARLIKGLTQTELAAVLGVSSVSVSKWERGECFPQVKRLKQVSKVLEIPISEFLKDQSFKKEVS